MDNDDDDDDDSVDGFSSAWRIEGKVATNDNLDGMTVNGRTVFRQIGWKWAWAKTTTTTRTTKHRVAINRYKIY